MTTSSGKHGCVVDLIRPLPKVQIVVKTPSGKLTPVDLNSGDSYRMIKEKIERLENTPISDQSLSLKGMMIKWFRIIIWKEKLQLI
jgi:hypothetical protein